MSLASLYNSESDRLQVLVKLLGLAGGADVSITARGDRVAVWAGPAAGLLKRITVGRNLRHALERVVIAEGGVVDTTARDLLQKPFRRGTGRKSATAKRRGGR